MLLRFIPEFWVDDIELMIKFLVILFLILWYIISKGFTRKKDKNFQMLNQSVVVLPVVIMFIVNDFLLADPYEQMLRYHSTLYNFIHISSTIYYILLFIVFGLSIYVGIHTALFYKKINKISYLVIGILCSSFSSFGFVFYLFKVLQMFKIVS